MRLAEPRKHYEIGSKGWRDMSFKHYTDWDDSLRVPALVESDAESDEFLFRTELIDLQDEEGNKHRIAVRADVYPLWWMWIMARIKFRNFLIAITEDLDLG